MTNSLPPQGPIVSIKSPIFVVGGSRSGPEPALEGKLSRLESWEG